MEEPIPLADELRKMGAIEEAIEEELLDSHPLGDFVKQVMPARSSKRRGIQRILVVLKRDDHGPENGASNMPREEPI